MLAGRRATIQVFGQLEEAPEAPDWDSSGWTMLSEQTVDGKRDTDVVQVGRDDGKFSSLMFVVLDGDIDMDGITINLTRGKSLEPELRQSFKNGSRTRQIDLPGKRAVIKDIELRYGTKRGNGKARVQIWAR